MNISSPLQYRCQVCFAGAGCRGERVICRVVDDSAEHVLTLNDQDCQAPVTVVRCVLASLLPFPLVHEAALDLREQLRSLALRAPLDQVHVHVPDVGDGAGDRAQPGNAALACPFGVPPGACHVNRLQRLCDKHQESIATANVSSVTSDREPHSVVSPQGTWH